MASSSSTTAAALPEPLIPGLPNDISVVILASLPLPIQSRLRFTCREWRRLLYPSTILPIRRLLRLPSHQLLALFPSDPSLSSPFLFDPSSLSFLPLPPLPCSPHLFYLSNFSPLSLRHHLYLLGGSLFDAHSYPLGHPVSSAAVHSLDLAGDPPSWIRLPDMPTPRGSFASAAVDSASSIIVAGGGSRHPMYPSQGSRIVSVEWYDMAASEWRMGEKMPRQRAGCVGFVAEGEFEEEFWVMGGYGEYRAMAGVVPADVYCRDAVVLGLRSGKWREVGDMWEEGERRKLGAVGVVEGEDGLAKGVFMLDRNEIFRYDFAVNRWLKESSLRRKIPASESCGFAAMNGELYVLTTAQPSPDISDLRKRHKKRWRMEIQVYNPEKKKWRFLIANPPFQQPIDFKTTMLCTIRL
ncbi:F-box/kelch-repeat protein OR23 [Typha angustifolia]|uniref:F-box/kelch-repeat protein OR23 n=1 Tax=Typha angustifolia TaxID=59011 RepID=UPI003C2C0141